MGALRAVSGEIASVVGHLVRYPTGLGRDWQIAPRGSDHAAGKPGEVSTPILLIPGLADNKSIFLVLRRALAESCDTVVSFGYSPLDGDVRAVAARLGPRIEELCVTTGAERVHLVGHSLGGLIARYYVQRLGGSERVDTVVTLATPHGGTLAAWLLAPVPMARQMSPGSDLLAELAEAAPACPTRFVAFSSDFDEFILPPRHGALAHPDLTVRNVALSGVGHLGLPSHPDAVREVCAALGPTTPQEHEDNAPVAS